mgnify:CR=1 FL=1
MAGPAASSRHWAQVAGDPAPGYGISVSRVRVIRVIRVIQICINLNKRTEDAPVFRIRENGNSEYGGLFNGPVTRKFRIPVPDPRLPGPGAGYPATRARCRMPAAGPAIWYSICYEHSAPSWHSAASWHSAIALLRYLAIALLDYCAIPRSLIE